MMSVAFSPISISISSLPFSFQDIAPSFSTIPKSLNSFSVGANDSLSVLTMLSVAKFPSAGNIYNTFNLSNKFNFILYSSPLSLSKKKKKN